MRTGAPRHSRELGRVAGPLLTDGLLGPGRAQLWAGCTVPPDHTGRAALPSVVASAFEDFKMHIRRNIWDYLRLAGKRLHTEFSGILVCCSGFCRETEPIRCVCVSVCLSIQSCPITSFPSMTDRTYGGPIDDSTVFLLCLFYVFKFVGAQTLSAVLQLPAVLSLGTCCAGWQPRG